MAEGDSNALVPAAADVALTRDVDGETKDIAKRIAKVHHEIAEASQHAFDDPEELEKLTPKQRKIALAALLPRTEVPFAIQAAHDFTLMRERREQAMAPKRVNLFIGEQNNFGVALPAKRAQPAPEDVVVIDAEFIAPKEDGDE